MLWITGVKFHYKTITFDMNCWDWGQLAMFILLLAAVKNNVPSNFSQKDWIERKCTRSKNHESFATAKTCNV